MKNANTKSRASSVSKLRARLLKSWAAVSALAASLLFIGLLTGCPHNQPPAKPVDPAAIFRTDGHGKITGYKCAKEELPAYLVIPAKIGNEEIKEIASWAFSSCTGLTSVTLPANLTKIDSYAFYGCTGLTNVHLPVSITKINGNPFSGCTGITSLTIDSANAKYKTENNILYSKDGTTLIFAAGGLTSINISDTVTTIGDSAFSGCTGLTSITLPANLTQIESGAFSSCTGLTSVTLPANLTQIAEDAFSDCTGLTSLTIDSANAKYKTENNILYSKDGTTLIFAAGGLTSITNIPNTVTTIGDSAFYGCTGLTSITLPANLTKIGDRAFSSCTGLTSITLPANLTQIGVYAFSGCTGLTSAVFADTNNWKVYDNDSYSGTSTTIEPSNLAEASKAATYLREGSYNGGYCDKYWKKR